MIQPEDPKAQEQIKAARQEVERSIATHPVVSEAEWLEARRALLEKEKAYVRQGDTLAAEIRALPWVRVTTPYTFTSAQGGCSLIDLFGRHSQLFVKHFMMEPDQPWQCVGCSLLADHINGLLPHFDHHDMAYVAVSRAPIEQIESVRQRMGWNFSWVSSFNSEFNYDFHVSFRPHEAEANTTFYNFGEKSIGPETFTLSGVSVFYKNPANEVFHTYGAFDRGDEQFMGIYGFFDVLPRGREEYGPVHGLPDWAKVHDQYQGDGTHKCGCWPSSTSKG